MALKGKKPVVSESRLKVMLYGDAGVGKTMAAIQFPRPYIIDTERSTNKPQYVKAIEKAGGAVLMTSDFDEVVNETKELLNSKHEYKTLVIDSMTLVHSDLLEKNERRVKTDFGRHYTETNNQMKKFVLNYLFKIDMNVVITCHSKKEYGDNLKVLGTTFDGYKKLDFMFDLVLEISKNHKERYALIKKSRIEKFTELETIKFSYDEIANRYDRSVLERDAVPQQLATDEQIKELITLIDILKVDEEICQKWLDKAQSDTWNDMSQDNIEKCIAYLKDKISGVK